MAECPNCGSNVKQGSTRCLRCGTELEVPKTTTSPAPDNHKNNKQQHRNKEEREHKQQYRNEERKEQQPKVVEKVVEKVVYVEKEVEKCKKNKFVAAMLAIFLGGIGIHKFYLGKPWEGLLYIVLAITYLPMIIGFIEGIIYLISSEETFCTKYVAGEKNEKR